MSLNNCKIFGKKPGNIDLVDINPGAVSEGIKN